jgi:hypothetical protein
MAVPFKPHPSLTLRDPHVLHSRNRKPIATALHQQQKSGRPYLHPSFKKNQKTYNSGDSPVVTHLTTNPPVSCLSTAERTGSAGRQDPMVVCGRIEPLEVYVEVFGYTAGREGIWRLHTLRIGQRTG